MRIALDAMGGDHAPSATVEGAVAFARKDREERVVLVGDEPRMAAELARLKAPVPIELCHAPEVVGMDEHPGQAVRRKRGASIRVCFELLAQGRADAVVSAGNSGAVMAAALLVLGRLPGVERPAIVTEVPTVTGRPTVLLDSGANVSCRVGHLVQFAHLGEVYARRVLGVARPRVALLSNGEEETKGTDLTRETLKVLKGSALDFVGYVEGRDLFAGAVDVVVTDGFTGNVALKTAEGAGAILGATLKRELEARSARVGGALLSPAISAFRKLFDWAEVGGAPLLGVDGVCLISHGRSHARAIQNALAAAARAARLSLRDDLVKAAEAAEALARTGG